MRKNIRDKKTDFNSGIDNLRSSFSSFSGFSQPREMHKAKCSECGKECEVPFKPREGRPVYCRECFRNKKPRREE